MPELLSVGTNIRVDTSQALAANFLRFVPKDSYAIGSAAIALHTFEFVTAY